jgi:hypothetical protein
MSDLYDSDVPDLYAAALSGVPDSMYGQPPLPLPATCPVTLEELLTKPK